MLASSVHPACGIFHTRLAALRSPFEQSLTGLALRITGLTNCTVLCRYGPVVFEEPVKALYKNANTCILGRVITPAFIAMLWVLPSHYELLDASWL